MVAETLTRREHGKIEGAPQVLATPTGLNTTNLTREIVMPSHDTALDDLIASILSKRRKFKRGVGTKIWHNLYYFRCLDCGLIKIGFSRDYRLRRRELERRSDHKHLEVLGVESGDRWCEAQIHSRLWADHVGHEWYRPSETVMAYVAQYARPPFKSEL